MPKKFITLSCAFCGSKFQKTMKSLKRNIKKGNIKEISFCSLKCENKKALEGSKEKGVFTWYVKMVKNKSFSLVICEEDISDIWFSQEGKCALSSISLSIVKNKSQINLDLHSGVLAKKRPEDPYTKDNLMLISRAAEILIRVSSYEETREFFAMQKNLSEMKEEEIKESL